MDLHTRVLTAFFLAGLSSVVAIYLISDCKFGRELSITVTCTKTLRRL